MNLNPKQRKIVVIGLFLMAAAVLFPPWYSHQGGRRFFPLFLMDSGFYRLDLGMLSVEFLLIGILCTILYLMPEFSVKKAAWNLFFTVLFLSCTGGVILAVYTAHKDYASQFGHGSTSDHAAP